MTSVGCPPWWRRRRTQWLDTGTGTLLDVTSPDNVLLSGRLANGAVASVHVGAIPFAGSGYRMEIYGREGTLVATGEDSPQLGKVLLHGAKRDNKLAPMPVPERLTIAAPGTPPGEASQRRSDVYAVRSGHPRAARASSQPSRPQSICIA